MPREPIDYSKTIIYHFVCNDISIIDTYVGHTTRFSHRKSKHKSCCINEKGKYYNLKLYQNIRANGYWENWEMKPLEEFACENKIQATIREQYWIDKLKAKLNMTNAVSNKEQIQETRKRYSQEHKEKHKEYVKKYDESHREQRRLAKQKYDLYKRQCKLFCDISI